jgi:cytochrome d ubiquinol oxidase subunit II
MEIAAFTIIWVALGLYALLAGADFGVGVWVLLSYLFRRGEDLRRDAMGYFGPVWEINTLFLVFFMVGLMSAFPRAIGVLGLTLIPLVLVALVMFVLRAGAYALLHSGVERGRTATMVVFGVSSVLAGVLLGYTATAPASGFIRGDELRPGFYTSAIALASLPMGLAASAHLSALAVCAYAAARESRSAAWYRRAALVSGFLVLPCVGVFTLTMLADAPHTAARLQGAHALPMAAGALLVAAGTLALWRRRHALAALLVFAGYLAGLLGGAFAQLPYLIYPGLTLERAAAPDSTLMAYLVVTAAGGPLLIAAMVALYHTTLGPDRRRRGELVEETARGG